MSKYHYKLGQEIEYSNGIFAYVVATRTDGYFVIYQEDGYAACYMDATECSEEEAEIWSFLDEADPFVPTLSEAQSKWPRVK